ncbi:MAG: hypothetical protein UR28_C0021G0024 [Candidatus Peregrinibacteria bacterium GW2011_GWF2_33_10]|nr:MAG: hypothetical protein UR28_C0021G0024 [Candidatus Peregrinibacteria bacterium GW2011_GWF2_33_10]
MKNKNKAFSLFISISIITAISIVALTLSDIIINSLTRTNESVESVQAYYAAQSAISLAKYQLKSAGPGYDSGSEASPNIVALNHATAKWWIKGLSDATVKLDDGTGYYPIPRKGNGDAFDTCTIINKNDEQYDSWDHPCNWNKLYPGKSIAIPLYIKDKDGNIHNILDNLSEIRIIVRAPCKTAYNSEGKCNDGRYEISGDFNNQIVVNWMISGMCDGSVYVTNPGDPAVSCSVSAYKDDLEEKDSRIKNIDVNNYIYLGTNIIFNDLKVSTNKLQLSYPFLINFLTDTTSYNIDKPVLQMTEMTGIYDVEQGFIPYLEYQIEFALYDDTSSVADISEMIYAKGETENFTKSASDKIQLKPTLSEYTISL